MTKAPALPAPFSWDGEHIAVQAAGGNALFTTRRGGTSDGPYASLDLARWAVREDPRRMAVAVRQEGWEGHPPSVERNMGIVATQVGIAVPRWAQGHQVHERRVRSVAAESDLRGPFGDYDGQATSVSGVACAVLTADCLPVALLGDGAVAMLHAGWRGLAGGVLEAGVEALRDLGASGDIVAAIGPGIGGCCYEVGDDVLQAFGDDRTGPALLDLKAIAATRLLDAGVTEIHDAGLCTMCSDDSLFFSYRRDGSQTGRQAGLAWLS